MERRTFLTAAGGLAGSVALAGCTSLFETRSARVPPPVENPPSAIFIPTHSEGMKMAGKQTVGDLDVALMFTYPERFWTVTGSQTELSKIENGDTLHLMAVVWATGTNVLLPDTGLSLSIVGGQQEVIYPMLSQRMSFHYGGNFTLDGEGTYTVRVSVGGMSTKRTGTFRANSPNRQQKSSN